MGHFYPIKIAEVMTSAGNDYYPKRFIVYLNLKAGDNEVVIAYSKWRKPVQEGLSALAAYLTDVTVK